MKHQAAADAVMSEFDGVQLTPEHVDLHAGNSITCWRLDLEYSAYADCDIPEYWMDRIDEFAEMKGYLRGTLSLHE